MPRTHTALFLALAAAALAGPASAQSVTMQGTLGDSKALLMVNGAPVTLGVGASAQGVTLRSLRNGQAEVEIGGKRQLLAIGSAPVSVGGGAGSATGAGEIVLPAGPGGHFMAQGAINGKPVRFMVDTGATTIAMSLSDAERIGVDWKRGQRSLSQTAGGVVPIYMLNLTSVRVGEVEVYNVAAAVIQAEMPFILLGNSFLSRFSISTTSDTMRLSKTR
jgi:aspartyl protease family protein